MWISKTYRSSPNVDLKDLSLQSERRSQRLTAPVRASISKTYRSSPNVDLKDFVSAENIIDVVSCRARENGVIEGRDW